MANPTILTPPFRACFPNVWEPRGFAGQNPKYSVTAVWQTDDLKTHHAALWKALRKALDAACKEKFRVAYSKLPSSHRRPLRDGAEKAELAGFGPGTVFAALSSKHPPGIVDLRRQPMDKDDPRVYPGCMMRASVNVYTYDNVSKGVAIGLQNLQWLGHGDRLGGRADAAAAFADDPPGSEWFEAEANAPVDDDDPAEYDSGGKFVEDDDDDIPF